MNNISLNAIEPLLISSLTDIETACGRVASSFNELVGCVMELATAELAAQSAMYCVPDDDEEESQQVNDALSLREDAKFDVGAAVERALNELAQQERVLNDARAALEQTKESLQLRENALSVSMQLYPKPGCSCAAIACDK